MIYFILFIIISILFGWWLIKKPEHNLQPSIEVEKEILERHVEFYRNLDLNDKNNFLLRIRSFLKKVRITGIKTDVENIDRVLIAAGAVIPIFGFKNWEYKNINEILLYPNSFGENFKLKGSSRNTLGMVGNGPMQNVMIISKEDVRSDFIYDLEKHNTIIHEFVHLIDKSDGETDGIPLSLLAYKYSLPWLQLMHEEIQKIKNNNSDINPYGSTNQAEFFAVVAEYFFQSPELMREKHPELFKMLEMIFNPEIKN